MTDRAFPVVFASRVSATADFYQWLGFTRHSQLPTEGEPGYVGLRRGAAELAVVSVDWPREQYHATVGAGVRFEMFVYATDVDAVVAELRERGRTVLPG